MSGIVFIRSSENKMKFLKEVEVSLESPISNKNSISVTSCWNVSVAKTTVSPFWAVFWQRRWASKNSCQPVIIRAPSVVGICGHFLLLSWYKFALTEKYLRHESAGLESGTFSWTFSKFRSGLALLLKSNFDTFLSFSFFDIFLVVVLPRVFRHFRQWNICDHLHATFEKTFQENWNRKFFVSGITKIIEYHDFSSFWLNYFF